MAFANTPESQIAGTEGSYTAQTFDKTVSGFENKYIYGFVVNEEVTAADLTIELTKGGTDILSDIVDTGTVLVLTVGGLHRFAPDRYPEYVNTTSGSLTFLYYIND